MEAKFLTFYFGRLKLTATAGDKKGLILTGLKTDKFCDLGGFRYGFFDVEQIEPRFVYGKLVKYKNLLQGEIVDERSHRTGVGSLPYGTVGRSDFFLHFRSGVLAYRPLPSRISAQQFWDVFARLIEIAHDDLLVSAVIESKGRRPNIPSAIKKLKTIQRIAIEIRPTNPSNRDVYRRIDERLKELQAKKMKVIVEGGKGGLDKAAVLKDDLYRSLEMAKDGYGKGTISGIADDRRSVVTTMPVPVKKEIVESPEPRVMLDALLPTFKEIWQTESA